MNTLEILRQACAKRDKEWDPGGQLDLAFFATELGGEAGEALNIAKKLERERYGIPGSRATLDDLAEELSDVIISAINVWNKAGIQSPLWPTVARKFNASSEKHGFDTVI